MFRMSLAKKKNYYLPKVKHLKNNQIKHYKFVINSIEIAKNC